MRALRWLMALAVAALVTEALAAAAATHFVLRSLAGLGVDVSWSDRLATTAHDIAGMLPSYAPIIGAGFLVAMPVAGFLAPHHGGKRAVLFAVAGAVAVLAALLIMKAVFEITPIAGARSTAGLAAQMLAGAVGGLVFSRLSAARDPDRRPAG